MDKAKRIAIVGGGPSGLFMFKKLVEKNEPDTSICIFEKENFLGAGMPYSINGANEEHITNVSGNEIPELEKQVDEWIKNAPTALLNKYKIFPENYNDYKVMPRLFFGNYLANQFEQLIKAANDKKIDINLYLNTAVTDIKDNPESDTITITTGEGNTYCFEKVILSTGHYWPKNMKELFPTTLIHLIHLPS